MSRAESEISLLQISRHGEGGFVVVMRYEDGKKVRFTIGALTSDEEDQTLDIVLEAVRRQLAVIPLERV